MTNEKAKEILDFLALKAGFKCFSCPSNDFKFMTLLSSTNTRRSLLNVNPDLSTCDPDFCKYINASGMTYLQSLEVLFSLASQGHIIDTLSGTYLEPYATLEQVLIEMDLFKCTSF